MKKRFGKHIAILVLAVLVLFAVLSSCSAENPSVILCNVKLDTEESSRSFDDPSYSNNLSECRITYCATYQGSGSCYGDTKGIYVDYDKSKGIVLSQGLWNIDCIWIKEVENEDGSTTQLTIASGSTGSIWVNLNTKSFLIYLDESTGFGSVSIKYNVKCNDNSVNNIRIEYSISKWESPSSKEEIEITEAPEYSVGNEPDSLRVFSLHKSNISVGKYLLVIKVFDTEAQPNALLFTDVLGFMVREGLTTEINGKCFVKKDVSGSNEYIYWDENPASPPVSGENNKTNVGGENTDLNTIKNIENEHIYIINSDGGNNMELGHTGVAGDNNRIITPKSSETNPVDFGINLNGTDVTLTTANGTHETYVVIELPSYSELTLFNNNGNLAGKEATWAFVNRTPLAQQDRRFESNVVMDGGSLNIVGTNSPSGLSNGDVVFRGPVATDSDNEATLVWNRTRKQGAINFNSKGGTVVVDGRVSFEASVGFSSWSTSKPGKGQYTNTITEDTNINVTIKNGATVSVVGDTKEDDRYIDTAYGAYLRCGGHGGAINFLLDNGKIIASGSGSNDESGIRIDDFQNGTINITLKNGSVISSSSGSGLYFKNCAGATINVMIASDSPDDTIIGDTITGNGYKIRVGENDNTTVNIIVTNSNGVTKKATISNSISSFEGLEFVEI